MARATVAQKQAVYAKPVADQYDTIYTNVRTGATVSRHELTDTTAADYPQKTEAAKAWALLGKSSRILPEIDGRETEARARLMPAHDHPTSNPDLWVDGTYMDVKSPKRAQNIGNLANDAARQCADAIICDNRCALSESIISARAAELTTNPHYTRSHIHFFTAGHIITKNTTGTR